ncbi:uncharacterized protein [Haliotis asinina]|uniref:uncharacterized protein n=1 Tax=Haliotis asinina TaxID=109174 RepID=UPI0035320E57
MWCRNPVTKQPVQMIAVRPSEDKGAEGGGTGAVDSLEQQSGCEETLQDDACKITISANGSDDASYEDTIEDIGLSVWFHLKRCGNLQSKLRPHFFEIKEKAQDNIVLTYMKESIVSNGFFMSQCKTIRQILKETTENYCQVSIQKDEKQKEFIVRNWTKTNLYQSKKATAHRARSGCLIIVADKSSKECLDGEVQKLKEQYKHALQLQDDVDNQSPIEGKRNCSPQPELQTSSRLKWEPGQVLLEGDSEMVNVMLQTTVSLTDCQQSFLNTQPEAQKYVISCFRKHGIDCAFDFSARELVLTAVKDVQNKALDEFVLSQSVPCIRVSWFSIQDLTNMLQERVQNSKGKFMVVGNDIRHSLTVMATNDIFQDICSVIGIIMVDAVEREIELGPEDFKNLLLLKQWKEFDPLLVDVTTGVVLIRTVHNKRKCLILVVGKKEHFEELSLEIDGYFQSKAWKCITLSDDEHKLIQTCQGAVKFIEQAVKEEGYKMHIRGNVVLISDDISKFKRSCSHYIGLILSKIIRQEEPIFEFFTLEELHDLLYKDFKAYHDKLVIHINKHERCLTLTGTKDIFPAVEEQFEKIQTQYKRVEQEVPLSPEMIEYLHTQGHSELQKMEDDLRLKLTFPEQGEPFCRVSGPLIGVEKVKGWIHDICTLKEQKIICKETSRVITLKELEHQLLKQSVFARDFVREAYEEEGFAFDMDSMFRNATVKVDESKDMPKALRLLSWCLEIVTVDLGQEQIDLTPKQAKDMVCRHFPDFSQKMFVFTKESDHMLSLIVTKDVAATVIRTLNQIMDDYAHEEVCLYLEPEEIAVVMKQVEKMKQTKLHSLHLFPTSESVSLKGACVSVRKSWEAICELLRVTKMSRNAKSSRTMRMCEQAVSELVCVALEKNEQIRRCLKLCFDDHGFDFEVSNNKLRLFAGSVTALQKVREIFPSLIIERRFCLVNEPVVKLLGMDKIGEKLCCELSFDGKLVTNVDVDTCQIRIVFPEDIRDIVEDHFHHLKKMFEEAVIETEEEEHNVQQLEDELSHNEPVLRGKFRLYEEDGKLHVVAAGDCLMLVKKKVEQMLHWKIRERGVAKNLPKKELKLTEIQFEFIQKPEVITYIDEKLDIFQFEINRNRKSLNVYALKAHSLDKCKSDIHACMKEDTFDLSGGPVVENVCLSHIKDKLDVQEPLHHGKLLIRVDDQKQCLAIICTDDVQEPVFRALSGIMKTYSNTTLRLPLSSEKWGHIKTLFPGELREIPQDVRTEYCSEQGLQIMGPKEEAIQAKAIFEEIIEKLHVEEFPLYDDVEIFQTDEGQELINDIQKHSECVITIDDHETFENEASEMAIKDYLAQLHLEQTSDCVRLSQWTSKGNCMISVIQGSMDDLSADVLAVPVVGGEVPSALSSLKKDGSLKKRIQSLDQTKDQLLMIHCDNHGLSWLKTKRVVFFFVPVTLKEGKGKEKESVRKTVQRIITQEAKSQTLRNSSCVFVVETLNKKGLFGIGVKAIIRGSQEAFEECVNCIDVQLLADETMSTEVVKTLKKACPESRQISRPSQVKEAKRKFPGKGENVEQPKPSIKIVVGKLENVEADVLVNSAHDKLDLTRGRVSRALNAASGGQLQKQCKKKYPNGLQLGEVAVTEFQVQGQKERLCRVFHGFLYKFPSGSQNDPTEDECWKVMYRFIYQCLNEACKLEVESIAFPVLGTGTLNYPVENVAEVMFTVVEWFFNETTTSSLKTVKFVVYEGDKDIIQVFDAEWMARSYRSSTKQGSLETRQKCGNLTLQFIASDIRKCNGCSDGLLCFWQKHQLKDPQNHPLVGEHLEDIEWKTYGQKFDLVKQASTNGGSLPANFIFHTLCERDFMTSFEKGLKRAAENKWRTVQVMLFPEDMKINPQAFVSDLQNILKQRSLTGDVLSVVTVVVPDKAWYTEAVSQLTNPSGFISYMKNFASSLWPTTGQASSIEASRSESCGQVVVTGRSKDDCEKGYNKLMEGIKQLKERSPSMENSSPVDSPKSGSENSMAVKESATDLDLQKRVLTWKGNVYHLLLQDGPLWREMAEELKSLCQISVEDHADNTYMVGQFEDIVKACKHMIETYNIEPDQKSSTGARPKTSVQGHVDMKVTQLDAMNHLFGQDEVSNFCEAIDDPVNPGQRKVFFRHSSAAQAFQNRIMGIIQEELPVPQSDWQRGDTIAKEAMKGHDDVYITYDIEKHAVIMFAENWDTMGKAKRRVQHQTGSGKTSSRGNRRFAAIKAVTADAESKIEQGTVNGSLLTIKVYKTDITTLPVDAIVNAANENLSHGGGVARAIAKAAGSMMEDECQKVLAGKQIPVTELAVTTAGNLPSKKIFHAVGPCWSNYAVKDYCSRDLCLTILRCLCAARNWNCTSIAFPSISAAIFGVPQDVCARMYVQALKTFDTVVSEGSLRVVHFVDVSDTMVTVIRKELAHSWKTPVEGTDFDRDKAFINRCLGTYFGMALKHHSTQSSDKNQHVAEAIPAANNDISDGYFKFSDVVSINIFQNDVFETKTNALVSWEDTALMSSKPFIKAMIKAGGSSYEAERDRIRSQMSVQGTIAETSGGKLPQDTIFHAVVGLSITPSAFGKLLRQVLGFCVKKECHCVLIPLCNQILTGVSSKNKLQLFIEAMVDSLSDLSRHKSRPTLYVHIAEQHQRVVDDLKQILQEYLTLCGYGSADNPTTEVSGGEECVICLSAIVNPKRLKCGHTFCTGCIDSAFKHKKMCPTCKTVCGVITGDMPPGRMTVFESVLRLPGYEKCGTIEITYSFNGGYQNKDEHPEPGKWYRGFTRTAFLPNNAEGQKVLSLLRVAWERRLTFTIGSHGYPDPGYLKRVQEELAAQGVTEADLGATGSSAGTAV